MMTEPVERSVVEQLNPPVKSSHVVVDMGSSDVVPKSSWLTPLRLLIIFCVISLINYMDRGVIASNGVNGQKGTCTDDGICIPASGIQGQFNLSNSKDGIISFAFMGGLLLGCLVFADLAKRINPFRLIGVGLSIWTLAVVGCSFSFHYWSIVICRTLVGFGEASFVSLAAPFIHDKAPANKKAGWLGLFYMCIPTGNAIGYLYGGLVGQSLSWHHAFGFEAILMVPFAVLVLIIKPLELKGFAPKRINAPDDLRTEDGVSSTGVQERNAESWGSSMLKGLLLFMKDMKALLINKVFVVNVLGFVAYNFVLGAYSYWGPKAGYNIYKMKNADMIFGGITAVCGIVGTIAGGYILDRMTSTIPNAFKLLTVTTFIGGAFCFGSFCFKNMYGFMALFSVGELLVFAVQGPVNFVFLHCVIPELRPHSIGISTIAIHLCGDMPSTPLVGLLQDHINDWRMTSLILTSVLVLAAIIWFIGIFVPSGDRVSSDQEQVTTNRSSVEPSLEAEQVQQTNQASAEA